MSTEVQPGRVYLTAGASGLIYILDEHRVQKEYFEDESYARERECRAFEILGSHPNIVHHFPHADTDNKIVLERGECLRALLKQHPSLSSTDRLEYAKQAAVGLQYIHRKGIVHADVGAQNMIVVGDPDNRQLKFIDFAGYIIQGDPNDSGACYEWCSYRPMRDEEGRLLVTKQTDIFAFGCMLYELVTGRQPHYDLIGHPATDDKARRAQERWEGLQLPDVKGLPLCDLIVDCWLSRVQSMDDIVKSLARY